jgi:hypothetical protein
MAGGFGRRPRLTSSSLAATIAALRKAQLAAEWSAIQDAWKNGGTYDFGKGKGPEQVTDALVLAYMQERRDRIAVNDPEYAMWNNGVQQMQFSVDESKIALQFKEGRISASQVASFYKSQLGKYAVDSEIYRTIAGKAADWAKSAAASAGSAAKNRAMTALQARLTAATNVGYAFDDMEATLTDAAVRAGLIVKGQTLADIQDTGRWKNMLANGIPVPGAAPIFMSDWQAALDSQDKALKEIVAVYTQAGPEYTKEVPAAKDDVRTFTNNKYLPSNAIDAEARYFGARQVYEQAMEDAHDNADLERAATAKYRAELVAISQDDSLPPNMAGGVASELSILDTGKASGPTWTDMMNATGGKGTGTSDAETLAGWVSATVNNADLAKKGYLVWGETFDSSGKPTWGYFDPTTLPGYVDTPAGISTDASVEVGQLTIDGQKVDAYMVGQPKYVLMLDGQQLTSDQIATLGGVSAAQAYIVNELTKRGETQAQAQSEVFGLVGYTFFGTDGTPIQYKVIHPDGSFSYFTDDPWGTTGATTKIGGDVSSVIGADNATRALGGGKVVFDTYIAPKKNLVYEPGDTYLNTRTDGAPIPGMTTTPISTGPTVRPYVTAQPPNPNDLSAQALQRVKAMGYPVATPQATQAQIDASVGTRWAGAGASAAGLARKQTGVLTPTPSVFDAPVVSEQTGFTIPPIKLTTELKLSTPPSLGSIKSGPIRAL